MSDPQFFALTSRRRGRPRADNPKVQLSARVPPADRAALAALASSRGTSLHQLTGEILRRVARSTRGGR